MDFVKSKFKVDVWFNYLNEPVLDFKDLILCEKRLNK